MATLEGNVEALAQAILGEARAEIEQIDARAQSEAASIRQKAQEAAERERKAILAAAEEQARRLRGQDVATAQMKARSLELEHREQLLRRAFDLAGERLGAVPQDKDYPEVATGLLREALVQLKAPQVEVSADQATAAVLTKEVLERVSSELGTHLQMGKSLESGTGVIVRSADGRLQFDNTLETRLARMQGNIRSTVFRVLLGESE